MKCVVWEGSSGEKEKVESSWSSCCPWTAEDYDCSNFDSLLCCFLKELIVPSSSRYHNPVKGVLLTSFCVDIVASSIIAQFI